MGWQSSHMRYAGFFDRRHVLTCPFCGRVPEEPHRIEMRFGETTGGRCECGAVYVYDETGHLQGEAFSDALALLYAGDYDAAQNASETDYQEETISFDRRLGRYFRSSEAAGGIGGLLDRRPRYIFLKKTGKSQK